jgi:dipeptidase E
MTQDFLQPDHLRIILASALSSAEVSLAPVWNEMKGKRALVVTTAQLGEGRPFTGEDVAWLENLGLIVAPCDIREHSERALTQMMQKSDMCILIGGNTFVLLHAMITSGFNHILAARAMASTFLVIGESAGAVVLGPSIEHVSTMDTPSAAPRVITEAMGWVSKPVLPHRGSPHWGLGEVVDSFLETCKDPGRFLIIDEEEIVEIRNGNPVAPRSTP